MRRHARIGSFCEIRATAGIGDLLNDRFRYEEEQQQPRDSHKSPSTELLQSMLRGGVVRLPIEQLLHHPPRLFCLSEPNIASPQI